MSNNFVQILFCVETNKKAETDRLYIKAILEEFYNIGNNSIKFIFMSSKYNYNNDKIINKIDDNKFRFSINGTGKTYVIYIFDKDRNAVNPQDLKFENNVKNFCRTNNFELVWFVRDIEDVMWGKTVSNNKKKKEAQRFYFNSLIKEIDIRKLSASNNVNARKKSNVLTVLNKIPEIQIS